LIQPIVPSSESAVHTLGALPQVALGYMLRVMMQHFSNPASFRDPALKNLKFVPDTVSNTGVTTVKSTTLRVTTVGNFSPQDADQQPAVILRHGGMTPGQSLSVGDRLHGITAMLGDNLGNAGDVSDVNITPQIGDEALVRMYSSSITVVATAPEYGAADAIGAEAYQEILDWIPIIRRDWRAYQLDAVMGEVGQLDGATKAWAVEINIPYTFLRISVLRPQAPLLKRITVQTP
jgi:hypothetical protein